MNEKISIIVPVYNLENYIKRTLDSICNQTYENIEIIVVDDGSNDNSYQIICDYSKKDSRIIPVHQKNGGVTSARLNGVKIATGEWIGFVDGDDQIDSDMYEKLLKNAIKYDAQISHCGYKMIFNDGRINYFHNSGCIVEQDNLRALTDLLEGSLVEPGLWNKLFAKELFDNISNDIIDNNIKINEDLLMNYYLFKESQKSVFVDFCPYCYIVRDGSASRTINKHTIFDPIKVKKIILENSNSELKPYATKAYLGTCVNTYSMLVINNADKEDLETVLSLIKEQKDNISLLNHRNKFLMKLILMSPDLYRLFYTVYSKYFQKKKYS